MMSIRFYEKSQIFELASSNMSYVFKVSATGHLDHIYAGPQVKSLEGLLESPVTWGRGFSPNPKGFQPIDSLDIKLQEYGTFEVGDFRTPSFIIRDAEGYRATDPRYVSHKIFNGKPALSGLPASFAEPDQVETLEITLTDPKSKIDFILSYSLFRDSDVLARSVRIVNGGKSAVRIEKASSITMDFHRPDFDLISFPGGWGRERQIECANVRFGIQNLSSTRGLSSAQCNPAFLLAEKNAEEDRGRVFAYAFVYSGNFLAEIEKEQWGDVRVQFGLNPALFEWKLNPGESFQTPEVLMNFSENGFSGISHGFHDFFRKHLMRSPWCLKTRPVLINNWEATYFDFNEEKLLNIARKASELGVELLVLDDGWFGVRNDDCRSLGDWYLNKEKLPCGMGELAHKINDLGMKFGLWFEPEMISPDSDLYRAHPDWCLHIPGRDRSESRNQLVLDMSREDVRNEIFRQMCLVLDNAHIEYIKWDANRHLTEIGSALLPADQQGETAHRYVLGFYDLNERLLKRYPNLLIEGCSGGGGRFDAGMLYYVPQIWCSDDSDAVERLKIQYGTSMIYPPSAMGAHVSAVPNHQVQRTTPFYTRGNVAMAGTFGYELDLNKLPETEQHLVSAQVKLYHKIHHLVESGDLYRLTSPYKDEITAWMNVAKDASEFIITAVQPIQTANNHDPKTLIRLKGLDPDGVYEDQLTGFRANGNVLMKFGLFLSFNGDAASDLRHFKRLDSGNGVKDNGAGHDESCYQAANPNVKPRC